MQTLLKKPYNQFNTFIEFNEQAAYHLNDIVRSMFPKAYLMGEVEQPEKDCIKIRVNLSTDERSELLELLYAIRKDVPAVSFIFLAREETF